MPNFKQPPCPTEHEEQVLVCSWARGYAKIHNDYRLELLHGDSSGVRVPIGCAVKMKRAGAIKGWPDLFLPVPTVVKKQDITVDGKVQFTLNSGFYGLFIELKRLRGGVVSQEQKEIHEALRAQGYRVEVCRGAADAIETIKEYLGLG